MEPSRLLVTTEERFEVEDEFDELLHLDTDPTTLSEFQVEVVKYIAGFIVRKILRRAACEQCHSLLSDDFYEEQCSLLRIKNPDCLTGPSMEICNFATRCEKLFLVVFREK